MSGERITGVMVDFLWEVGYRVIHLTEQEVEEEPDRIAELLRQELINAGWDPN
jgi:very-short-patch-repair endonuclease